MRQTITFEVVKVSGTYKYTDKATGKKRQKTREFSQTINPFNKNPDGSIKSYDDIRREITKERDEWLAACMKAGKPL